MRFTRSLVVGVAAALVLSACAGGNTGTVIPDADAELPAGVFVNDNGTQGLKRNEPVTGGSLKVAMIAPADALDPAMLASTGAQQVMQEIFDVLFSMDENGDVVPELAESLETGDNGKTWTMKLPTGVKFTDGTPFNAQAVVAHVTRVGAQGATNRSAADARQIESMATPDDSTVVFTLKAPSLTFPKVWGSAVSALSLIPSPASVAQWGAQVGSHPVGVGPFMLESFVANGNAKLVRNPDYRIDGRPYLDAVEFVTATDTQSRLAATIAGDIDLAMTQSGVDLADATKAGLTSLYEPTFSYFTMLMNLGRAPFDDVRFREAVIRAIDLEGLNGAVFDGSHPVMQGLFPKSNPFFVETDWPTYDAKKAKDLVEEWQADTGLEPEFELITTSPPEFQKQAQVLQQMLQDAGITMNIVVGDQPSMVAAGFSGNYDAQLRFNTLAPEVDQATYAAYHSKSGTNAGKGADPVIDELLVKAQSTADFDDRAEIYKEMQEQFAKWLPLAPLVQHQIGWYVGDKVGGFPGVWPGNFLLPLREVYIAD